MYMYMYWFNCHSISVIHVLWPSLHYKALVPLCLANNHEEGILASYNELQLHVHVQPLRQKQSPPRRTKVSPRCVHDLKVPVVDLTCM